MSKITQIVKKNGKIYKTEIDTENLPVYTARIKAHIYEALAAKAHENGRSIVGEINWRLEQSLKK